MPTTGNVQKYLEFRDDELNSATLYETLAGIEKDERLAEVYRRLAATERNHAATWERHLREAGADVPTFRASWRTRTLGWLARRMGIAAVLPTLTLNETTGSKGYNGMAEAGDMSATENSHARLLRHISRSAPGGMEGGLLAKLEGRHKAAGGNALRAAVLGASDGLVSNFNLIMGVAGASLESRNILLTGFAGLLAGGISMALGEWISVQSSRELYERQISTEREEIESAPEEEIEELVLIYQARGLDETTARQMAQQIMSNPDTALDALVRDELGIDPEELGGSAWEAAITSFLLFAVGAILPVIPYMFLDGGLAIAGSAFLGAVGLFAIGAAITLFTGRPVLYSGLRQVVFGLIAAAVTFGVGHLLGVAVSG